MREASFMITEDPRDYEDQMRLAPLEAIGAAHMLHVAAFNRGKPFASVAQAAMAIGKQARVLYRLIAKYPDLFAFVDEVIKASLQRYQCREVKAKSIKNVRFRPKNRTKSTAAATESFLLKRRKVRAGDAPPPLGGTASPPARTCEGEPRANPAAQHATPLPVDWRPAPEILQSLIERYGHARFERECVLFCRLHSSRGTVSADWSAKLRDFVDCRNVPSWREAS